MEIDLEMDMRLGDLAVGGGRIGDHTPIHMHPKHWIIVPTMSSVTESC
jgi:hypothetical protein